MPYADETFDAVVISNTLHIMPHPEMALAQIHRVLKTDGILFAPTFIHGKGMGFRLRVRILEMVGFHTYFKWNDTEFVGFLEDNGFEVIKKGVIGGDLVPLCFAAAKPACKNSKS